MASSNPPNPLRDVVIVGGTGNAGGSAATAVSTVPAPAGAGTDKSITATTSTQVLMAANTSRIGFFIKNDTAIDVYIAFGIPAVAAAGAGAYKISANGGYLESPPWGVCTSAINIIAASGTPAISAREF